MHPGPGDFNIWRKIEIEPWAKWFAWHPVKIHNKHVWFKTVYRRCTWHYGSFHNEQWASWEYGTLLDVLKQSQ